MNLLDIIFPPKCVCCGELLPYLAGDAPFCDECAKAWIDAKNECRTENYGQPMTVYNAEMHKNGTGGVCMYSVYYIPEDRLYVQNKLIFRLKELADARTCRFAAAELASVIRSEASYILLDERENAVIAWIPRRRSSVREYGFDHMEIIAKALSNELYIAAHPLLVRRGFSFEQKRLDTRMRFDNARRAMHVSDEYDVLGRTVILIDDIITSGASLNAAASLLLDAGAKRIITVTLAKSDRPLD